MNHYTKTPKWIIQAVVLGLLRPREARVLLFVVEVTRGFNREARPVSYAQISKGTGIGINHVRTTLAGLVQMGAILMSDNGLSVPDAIPNQVLEGSQIGCEMIPNQVQKDPDLGAETGLNASNSAGPGNAKKTFKKTCKKNPLTPKGEDEGLPFEAGVVNEPPTDEEIDAALKASSVVTLDIPPAAPAPALYPAAFEAFWEAYPRRRRTNKPGSFRSWTKAGAAPEAIMAGLVRWKESRDWQKDGGEYVCGPQVWLNRRSWEDYPEPGAAVVPIATASKTPREQYLTWARQFTAQSTAAADKVRDLVERAGAVERVEVSLELALSVLVNEGLDEAFCWVREQVVAGKARGVSNG